MRLIDADELVRDLMEEIPLAENVPIFKEIIEGQPTAYDIDKVVEELLKEVEDIQKWLLDCYMGKIPCSYFSEHIKIAFKNIKYHVNKLKEQK